MRIETAQPLFSFLQGGLFIRQANTLAAHYDLRHRWAKPPGDLILGLRFRGLDHRQILRLLTAAVSRLIGHWPHAPAGPDYWVHRTILALYGGFCKSFLEKFPRQPDEHTLLLKSFLDRVVENHLGQTPTIEYSALNRDRWKFLIDAGERLLDYQFPMLPQERPLEALPAKGYESELGWLEGAAEKLRFEVTRFRHFRGAEPPGRRSGPGHAKTGRALCRQLEPAW
jgi:hypothetical protein